jgi:RND family efflux transporter MFP subunit
MLYTCGMHPQVIQDHPGICPICHMKLTPLRPSGNESGERSTKSETTSQGGNKDEARPAVHIDPTVVQNIGLRTAAVVSGPLTQSLHAVGMLKLPESGLRDVSLKVSGWIEKLYADKEGMHVKKGDPLFEVYSPDLQVAAEEFIAAASGGEHDRLAEAARQKLKLLDIADTEIDALRKLHHAPRTMLFRSPRTGHIEEKAVVEGTAVEPGMKLLRIADHSTMWLEVQVFADDLRMITPSSQIEATIDGIPGKHFEGAVTFVYPHLDHSTRTLRFRASLPNPNFELKPGMFASVRLRSSLPGDVLQVPREAVIDTGEKQFVFVSLADGHFEPRDVTMGVIGDNDQVEILTGLSAGEQVVTSGQFLLDTESRTVEAIQKIRGPQAPSRSSVSEERP